MRAAAALWLMAAAGCATPPQTPIAPDVVRVEIPVKVEAKRDLPPRPDFAVNHLPLGAPLHEQARMCFAEREQRKAYEIELIAACK
jgi:hypothetical protein